MPALSLDQLKVEMNKLQFRKGAMVYAQIAENHYVLVDSIIVDSDGDVILQTLP